MRSLRIALLIVCACLALPAAANAASVVYLSIENANGGTKANRLTAAVVQLGEATPDIVQRNCERLDAEELRADGNFTFAGVAERVGLDKLRRASATLVLVPIRCMRGKSQAGCVVSLALRATHGTRTLAAPSSRIRIKAGTTHTVRLHRIGHPSLKKGRRVRLVLADHTSKKAFEFFTRAHAAVDINLG